MVYFSRDVNPILTTSFFFPIEGGTFRQTVCSITYPRGERIDPPPTGQRRPDSPGSLSRVDAGEEVGGTAKR